MITNATPGLIEKLRAFQSAIAVELAANTIIVECPEPGDLSDWALRQRAATVKATDALARACDAEAASDYAGQLGV